MEELENLKTLISKFIGLSPEFPEDESLAVQIGASLGKLHDLIQELEENSDIKNGDRKNHGKLYF
jgi:hypothetical protein